MNSIYQKLHYSENKESTSTLAFPIKFFFFYKKTFTKWYGIFTFREVYHANPRKSLAKCGFRFHA